MTPDDKFIIVGFSAYKSQILKVYDRYSAEIYEFDVCPNSDINKSLPIHQSSKSPSILFSSVMAITADSRYLILPYNATGENGMDEKSLIMIDIKERKAVHKFSNAHGDLINCIVATPDNKYIVSASKDKSIKLFDIGTKKQAYHFQEAHSGDISSVTVASNSKFIVSASNDLSLKIFDLETKTQTYEFLFAHESKYGNLKKINPFIIASIVSVSVTSDCRFAASGSTDGSVKVFDLKTKQLVYSLQNLHDSIHKVAFAPNGKYLVTRGTDGSMKLINVETIMHDGFINYNGKHCDRENLF